MKQEQSQTKTIPMLQETVQGLQLKSNLQAQQILEMAQHIGKLEKELFQLKVSAMTNMSTLSAPQKEAPEKTKQNARDDSLPLWTDVVEKRGRRGPSPPLLMGSAPVTAAAVPAVPVPVLVPQQPVVPAQVVSEASVPVRVRVPVPVQNQMPAVLAHPNTGTSAAAAAATATKSKSVPVPVPQKKEEEKKKPPPVPHHTAGNLAGGQQQASKKPSSLKASLSQLPTPEEKLKSLFKIPLDASDPAYVTDIKVATISLPLSLKARQHPQVAIAEAIQAWSGHKPLLISLLGPNIAEIFFDARLEHKILKLPRGVKIIDHTITTRDIPRRKRACLQAHFLGLREATLKGFPLHLQLEILRGAQSLIPKQLEKLEFWKLKNLSITRAIRALDPGVVQEAQEEEAV